MSWILSHWKIALAVVAWVFLSLAPRVHPPTNAFALFLWSLFERLMLLSWGRWGGNICPGWVDPPVPTIPPTEPTATAPVTIQYTPMTTQKVSDTALSDAVNRILISSK